VRRQPFETGLPIAGKLGLGSQLGLEGGLHVRIPGQQRVDHRRENERFGACRPRKHLRKEAPSQERIRCFRLQQGGGKKPEWLIRGNANGAGGQRLGDALMLEGCLERKPPVLRALDLRVEQTHAVERQRTGRAYGLEADAVEAQPIDDLDLLSRHPPRLG
jgi:hypothetical protein